MYERTRFLVGIFVLLIATILVTVLSVLLMFLHLIYTLQRQIMLTGLIFNVIPFGIIPWISFEYCLFRNLSGSLFHDSTPSNRAQSHFADSHPDLS
ncbi:hypothetical protein PMAYCL1PPCAC_16305 [Pristionchus mayeri]|uniref:Uncharacterized protein n=1 Tax=Pristionchus mayeri TaxID=1317129 RepID=A0AAN5HZ49_9BILA|nr:hypothetical protein PMAYCL1PPCAC_16305 [Pristionchus mayeri]